MQIDIPGWKYGNCEYFAPPAIHKWLSDHGLQYKSVGINSWGNGWDSTLQRSNVTYSKVIPEAQPDDKSAFKIMFPDIQVF
jgi:hypothetical protein